MKKRIFFFGTPDIAVPSLEALAQNEAIEVVGVGVFPDRPVGRKQTLTPGPVKVAAQSLGLPIFEINTKAELITVFKSVEHDLALVIAFGLIFPAEILNLTSLGVVNVHFSLLPEYRGASPVQAAILDSQVESGITWQRMVPALDAGDILWQRMYDIEHKTTTQVWAEFSQLTAQEMPHFIAAYTQGRITPQVQDENQATFCGKFTKTDGQIDLKIHTATQVHNAWRAFQPWPGVSIHTARGWLKLHDCALEPTPGAEKILAAGDSELWVKHAQLPGKPKALLADILRGHPNLLN